MADIKSETSIIFANKIISENIENVFDFINDKLCFGVSDTNGYLTDRGEYIVEGNHDWTFEDWLFWVAGIRNYDSLDEEAKAKLHEEFNRQNQQNKQNWMHITGINEEEINTLENLHKQYLAIKEYSKNPDNEEARRIIIETFQQTQINCLTYLKELVKEKRKISETDIQGNQLYIVLLGTKHLPSKHKWFFPIEYYDELSYYDESQYYIHDFDDYLDQNSDATRIAKKMHNQYLYYENLIQQLCLDKSQQEAKRK